jgi:hypothetical protein
LAQRCAAGTRPHWLQIAKLELIKIRDRVATAPLPLLLADEGIALGAATAPVVAVAITLAWMFAIIVKPFSGHFHRFGTGDRPCLKDKDIGFLILNSDNYILIQSSRNLHPIFLSRDPTRSSVLFSVQCFASAACSDCDEAVFVEKV